jgi:type I restriction enzyme S subunit
LSSWPIASLGDVVQINPRVGTERASADLPVSFVPMAAVCEHTGSIVSSDIRPFGQVSKGFPIFAENDVLFAKITPCMENGKAAIARNLENGTGAGSTEFFVLRPTSRILSEYVFHFIRRTSFRATCKANFTGSAGQQRVPKSFLEKVAIPLPSLDEQRRIVRLLDRAAEIRRRADAARAKARAIIPALFLDTFGDPAEDWSEITIDDILAKQVNAIRTGPFGSQLKHSEFTDEGVPVLGIDNVVDNEFKWAKPRHLPREKYEAFKRFRVFPGDVIVTIMGTTGRVAVAPDNLPECMNTKHLCAFTLDRSLAHPRFVQGALLFDPGVRAQARGKANGQIMEGWNMGIVRSIRLRLPPLPLQSAFAEQASRIESLARHLDAAAAKAEAMAAGLSAEVFG